MNAERFVHSSVRNALRAEHAVQLLSSQTSVMG